MRLRAITTTKKIKLIAHPGKLSVQYCKSSWSAMISDAYTRNERKYRMRRDTRRSYSTAGVVKPIIPGKSKAQGFVDKSAGIRVSNAMNKHWQHSVHKMQYSPSECTKRASNRHKGGHLAEGEHRDEHNHADNSVTYKHRSRATCGERRACS